MKKVLLLLSPLLATPAVAQFTPQENAELTELVESGVIVGQVVTSFGTGLRGGSDANYVQWKAVQDKLRIAANDCIEAMTAMGGCGTGPNGPFASAARCVDPVRANYVTLAFDNIDACVTQLVAARAAFVTLSTIVPSQAPAVSKIDQAVAKLSSIDRTLAYEDPWPNSEPAIIGPHGDVRLAQYSHGVFGGIYFQDVWRGGANLFHEIDAPRSPAMWDRYGLGVEGIGLFLEAHARIILASLEVVTAEDRAIWEADMAAGSGLRPFSFFRLLGEIELTGSNYNGPVQLFSGRNQREGMGQHLGVIGRWFGELEKLAHDAATNLDEVKRLAAHSATWHGSGSIWPAWRYLDELIMSYVLFYHGITTPPPGGCPEGQSCQPPQVCPQFAAQQVLLDGTHAEAQCVEIPQ